MRNLKKIKRVIVKIGSSSLVKDNLSVNEEVMVSLMSQFKKLILKGISPCLVTSGAIALGMHELALSKRPTVMAQKQACAAIGQAKLMESYNKFASVYGLTLGQILLNHDDFQVRKRMNYLSSTLDSMFKYNVIPVINENDALSVDEIKVGDNDTLSGMIAPIIGADLLILFSDIDGLYDKNPKTHSDASLISEVNKIDDELLKYTEGPTSSVGTGGMITKINAAMIANASSCDMIICNADKLDYLTKIVDGEEIGTIFYRDEVTNASRDNWIIFSTNSQGYVTVDEGLKEKLLEKRISVLPSGITKVEGEFNKGDVIEIKDKNGKLIAKGITNYSCREIDLIKGKKTAEIDTVLGYKYKKEVIHANDLVVIKGEIYGRFIK